MPYYDAVPIGTPTSAKTAGANATSISLSVPSGVKNGDLMVAAVTTNVVGTVTISGWTARTTATIPNTNGKVSTFTRTASGEPASYTVSTTVTSLIAAGMVVFRGLENVIDVAGSGTGTSASCVAPTVTTVRPQDMLIKVVGQGSGLVGATPTYTWPTSTKDMGTGDNTVSSGVGLTMAHIVQAAAGASGVETCASTQTADYGEVTLGLRALLIQPPRPSQALQSVNRAGSF